LTPHASFNTYKDPSLLGFDKVTPAAADRMFDRPPPHSADAESALLGACLLEPAIIDDVIQILPSADAFYIEANAVIYGAIRQTWEQKRIGDFVLLKELLSDKQQLDDVGGPEYIKRMMETTPGPAAAVYYAKIVANHAMLRGLIQASSQILFAAYNARVANEAGDAGQIIERAEQLVFDLAGKARAGTSRTGEIRLNQLLDETYQAMRQTADGRGMGTPTGFTDLDEMTTGLQVGEMVVLAARPSMGKSALMANIAEQVARGSASAFRTPTAIFSMEMDRKAIAERLISANTGITVKRMRSGLMSEPEYDVVCNGIFELSEAPLFVDDTPALTIAGLKSRARRMVARHGVKVILVDYLQLMSDTDTRAENRQVVVSGISRGLKEMARELGVAVIALSQLNRASENRSENRPRMSDLRESGSIEQDADQVWLLHREAYYHLGDESWERANSEKLNLAELIIAKQRNGPTGTVRLHWNSEQMRFKNIGVPSNIVPIFGSERPT